MIGKQSWMLSELSVPLKPMSAQPAKNKRNKLRSAPKRMNSWLKPAFNNSTKKNAVSNSKPVWNKLNSNPFSKNKKLNERPS
jgi:hypothetical protein